MPQPGTELTELDGTRRNPPRSETLEPAASYLFKICPKAKTYTEIKVLTPSSCLQSRVVASTVHLSLQRLRIDWVQVHVTSRILKSVPLKLVSSSHAKVLNDTLNMY